MAMSHCDTYNSLNSKKMVQVENELSQMGGRRALI